MWSFGSPSARSASPTFGVDTVKRNNVCVPGVIPPSCTLQKLAGKSSTRTTQCWRSDAWSTMRSGKSVGGLVGDGLLADDALRENNCGNARTTHAKHNAKKGATILCLKALLL